MIQAGVLGRQRGYASARKICECTCLWTWRVWRVCCTSDLPPLQPKRRKECVCLALCLMWVLYTGAVEGCALSVATCVTGYVGVFCLCACVCICLTVCFWGRYLASLQVEPAKEKAAGMSLSLGRGLGVPGHWARPNSLAREVLIPRAAGEDRNTLNILNTSVHNLWIFMVIREVP